MGRESSATCCLPRPDRLGAHVAHMVALHGWFGGGFRARRYFGLSASGASSSSGAQHRIVHSRTLVWEYPHQVTSPCGMRCLPNKELSNPIELRTKCANRVPQNAPSIAYLTVWG